MSQLQDSSGCMCVCVGGGCVQPLALDSLWSLVGMLDPLPHFLGMHLSQGCVIFNNLPE